MYKTIIMPYDGSEPSKAALPYAVDLASTHKAHLIILAVVQGVEIYDTNPPTVSPFGDFEEIDKIEKSQAEDWYTTNQQAELELKEMVDPLLKKGINASGLVLEGEPAETIIDFASQSKADVIVIATHGRSGLDKWDYGSVAERVLRGATTPVLLVRSGGKVRTKKEH